MKKLLVLGLAMFLGSGCVGTPEPWKPDTNSDALADSRAKNMDGKGDVGKPEMVKPDAVGDVTCNPQCKDSYECILGTCHPDYCTFGLEDFGCCAGQMWFWCNDAGKLHWSDCSGNNPPLDTCGWDEDEYKCGGISEDPSGILPLACCVPDCADKECDPDGCWGDCGECEAWEECNAGKCNCVPDSVLCNGTCCPVGQVCADDTCCLADCEDKDCGDDGCGGSCGECTACGEECIESVCSFTACDGKECGSDNCEGTCGVCDEEANEACSGGLCVCLHLECVNSCCDKNEVCFDGSCCQPACDGKDCGDDGCGGECGECGGLCQDGTCCLPDCDGKVCGGDGCGGECGPDCTDGLDCTSDACIDGTCKFEIDKGCLINDECVVDESNKPDSVCWWCAPGTSAVDWTQKNDGVACGNNATCQVGECMCIDQACGEICCDADAICFDDACCQPQCQGKTCGDDVCGGSCGECNLGPLDQCVAGACLCEPDCNGKSCGANGCGGSCGVCAPGENCQQDTCVSEGFVAIDAGSFWMGSPGGDCPAGYPPESCIVQPGKTEDGVDDENLHYVRLTQDFEMQVYEVTQGQWKAAFGGWNPSSYAQCGDSCPVEKMSWYDALAYANWKSEEALLTPCYLFSVVVCEDGSSVGSDYKACLNDTQKGIDDAKVALAEGVSKQYACEGYRLPTEAEWEYSARAGSLTAFYQTDGNDGSITHIKRTPVDPNLDQIGWYGGNSTATYGGAYDCSLWFDGLDECGPQPVGGKKPNNWGLHDMSGNVYEWCFDGYGGTYPDGTPAVPAKDPPLGVPSGDTIRLFRGGGWTDYALYCTSASRSGYPPGVSYANVGFRLARTSPSPCNPACDSELEECLQTPGWQWTCASKMEVVPSGTFWMGCNETLDDNCEAAEHPYHEVVTGSYEIDKTEVTNEDFALFLNEHGTDCGDEVCLIADDPDVQVSKVEGIWTPDAGKETHPVSKVTWFGADAYCEWAGKRLCTEAEWEKAARGGCEFYDDCKAESPIYPWGGTVASCDEGNFFGCGGEPLAVGSYDLGVSPYGALDMAGNVFEWTADCWHPTYDGAPVDGSEWVDDCLDDRTMRGSSFYTLDYSLSRTSYRGHGVPTYDGLNSVGFRCCRFECSPECSGAEVCQNGWCVVPCDDGNDIDWDGCTDGKVTEFQVNITTESDQVQGVTAYLADGRFVVLWDTYVLDDDPADEYLPANEIRGRIFDGEGGQGGSEIAVNTTTHWKQDFPEVASLSNGGFVAVWRSDGQDGSGLGVFAQVFNQVGLPQGPELPVNTFTDKHQRWSAVAGMPGGTFIVAWESELQDGAGWGIYGQRFDAAGATKGSEFLVNTVTTGNQEAPEVVAFSDGRFLVLWQHDDMQNTGYEVHGQFFTSVGSKIGSEFQVNSHTENDQWHPSAAVFADDSYIVTWISNGQDGDMHGVYGQLYDAGGNADGTEFVVNTHTIESQAYPDVAVLAGEKYVVVWQSFGQDGSEHGTFARLMDKANENVSPEFLVNLHIAGKEKKPSVDALPTGGFVVVWESCHGSGKEPASGQDSDGCGIFAQRFDKDGNKIYH